MDLSTLTYGAPATEPAPIAPIRVDGMAGLSAASFCTSEGAMSEMIRPRRPALHAREATEMR